MIFTVLILIAGFAALIKGADFFVSASSDLARRLNVPGLIIGLTVVAMGTSAPELAVSITAALQGSNEIAFSNVIGSNLFNMLGILGICAMIKPIPVDSDVLRRDFPFTILISVLVLSITCGSMFYNFQFKNLELNEEVGAATRSDGLLLLALLALYLIVLIINARRGSAGSDEASVEKQISLWKTAALLVTGIAMIIAGGNAVIYGAKELARAAGLSETIIGLTVIAFGTSLPELATSVVAARKGEVNMAVGNVIGSNIFNILLILGVSSTIHPIGITMASALDLIVLICLNIVLLIFAGSAKRISRIEGGTLFGLYLADMIMVFIR